MKKWFVAIVILLLPFSTLSVEARSQEVYIAIGDSLAAGQTPNRAIDAGYADLIAQEVNTFPSACLLFESISFSWIYYCRCLSTVQTDEAKELLKNATLVTISAGANDLLRLVQVNPANGTLSYQQIPADFALNNVRKNIAANY